jgi:methionyl-tRNA formyltransferase
MLVNILGSDDTPAYAMAREVVERLGHVSASKGYAVHVAIAPLLTKKIPPEELNTPLLGTLIFHPSPLPYGRGASAIRWAYRRSEPVTAATWFWVNTGKMDSGDICEMEVVKIDYSLRPREFYDQHILPAMARTLERALISISNGHIRRVPQIDEYATFDFKE